MATKTPVKFAIHVKPPKPTKRIVPPRGGKFADAIRHLISHPQHSISFPHYGKSDVKARLRVGFRNAAVLQGIKISTFTTDSDIHAEMKGKKRAKQTVS